jgi:hypothetical protein
VTRSNIGYFAAGVGACLLALAGLAKLGSLEAEIGRHGDQIDRLNVSLQMLHPVPSNVGEPALRHEHRHDTAGVGGPDGGETVTRRDTFDRRPSSGKGGMP